jgi:hypothetical protein
MDVKFFKSHIMKNLLLIFCFMLFAHAAFSQVQVVTLNGSASNDPDGQIQNYKWAQVGTTPMPCTITNANGAIATVVPSGGLQWVPGVYSFILTVTDNLGATSSATTNITVTSNQHRLLLEATTTLQTFQWCGIKKAVELLLSLHQKDLLQRLRYSIPANMFL